MDKNLNLRFLTARSQDAQTMRSELKTGMMTGAFKDHGQAEMDLLPCPDLGVAPSPNQQVV